MFTPLINRHQKNFDIQHNTMSQITIFERHKIRAINLKNVGLTKSYNFYIYMVKRKSLRSKGELYIVWHANTTFKRIAQYTARLISVSRKVSQLNITSIYIQLQLIL